MVSFATGNASFGYWGGGKTPSKDSRVSRINYSNDTATAAPKGDLNATRYNMAAAGNNSFGYFAGGRDVNELTSVDRIDYSSDASASPKGDLNTARRKSCRIRQCQLWLLCWSFS